MDSRAVGLERRLRTEKISFSEFQRAAAEDALVASLAAMLLGSGGRTPSEVEYSEVMGQTRYLWAFFDEIRLSLSSGRLKFGEEFAEDDDWDEDEDDDWDEDDDPEIEWDAVGVPIESTGPTRAPQPVSLALPVRGTGAAAAAVNAAKTSRAQTEQRSTPIGLKDLASPDAAAVTATKAARPTDRQKGPATWKGLLGRLKRFRVTPLYRWLETGRFNDKEQGGHREMRRISRRDKRVCPDCRYYDSLGWVPIGSLPMPGVNCQCHDRCRCTFEYR
jgi:hypothetical protein